MKILDKVQEVFNQYELKELILPEGHENVYRLIREFPEQEKHYFSDPTLTDSYLFDKYRKHIPKGWYGFNIGTPIIPAWCEIIDKILAICIANDPDFEIHQIKLKYGGIRFYVGSEVIEDINEVASLIDSTLYDKALIY